MISFGAQSAAPQSTSDVMLSAVFAGVSAALSGLKAAKQGNAVDHPMGGC